MISRASRNWRLERMLHIDKCILRLAAFEILFEEDIPPKVSIDEAVEMGKKFGSEDSAGFINGVLDSIYNTLVKEGRIKKVAETEDQILKILDSGLKMLLKIQIVDKD